MKRTTVICILFCMIGVAAQANTTNRPEPDQQLSITDVYDFLKKAEVYFIATMDGDSPRVRPFGTIAIFEGRLYIQTGKHKRVSEQIKKNPKVEICALNKEGNKWVRIEAVLVDDDRIEAKQHMLDEYPSLKSIYSDNDSNTQVFYLKNATATFSSFTDESKVVNF